ncbi:MAG: hypothetical protein AMK71_01345 [Nitrospira bacterium SG8_35_4]|nr:MAG: hypothetical protein AMK71_01345 [Nitrospira bacterium SG8_35_4]
MTKTQKRLWTGLVIMALLAPLGILLPALFHSGDAWGEWGTGTLEKLLGFVPEGLKKYADMWKAPAPDYNLGGEDASMTVQLISYIASGILGIAIITLVIYFISRFVVKNGK